MLTALVIWTALSLPAGIVVGKAIPAHHSDAPHGVIPSPGVDHRIAPGVFSKTFHTATPNSQVQQNHG